MAFARAFATRRSPATEVLRSSKGRKGSNRSSFEPIHWVLNPPPQLPVSDASSGWTRNSVRTGVLGIKAGMYADFSNNFDLMPLTVIKIPKCTVTQIRTVAKEGYSALQMAAGPRKSRNVTKPLLGHFRRAGIGPRARVAEFHVTPDAVIPVGTEISAKHFLPGQYVDITGITKGKGFQGVMKRHGFKGLPATHGVSLTHRSLGATGARQDPGKVWKGKRMPGRMGGKQRKVRNLVVWKVDTRYDAIVVRGAVPGSKGGWLKIQDAAWKPHMVVPPFPTYFPKPGEKGETIEAVLPVPADWGEINPEVDRSGVLSDLALFYGDAMKDSKMIEAEKIRSKKGSRGKAKKMEKKLIAEGKIAAKTGGQGASAAAADKKPAADKKK